MASKLKNRDLVARVAPYNHGVQNLTVHKESFWRFQKTRLKLKQQETREELRINGIRRH